MKKIIFMGTPEFAVPTLQKLIDNNSYEIVGVFTQPDKPTGRKKALHPPPIKRTALQYNLSVFQPDKLSQKIIIQIKKLQPDVIIVVAYGKIIPQEIIDIPPFGIINIHASLLPKYRGASPIQTAILRGDKKTGVTIMLVDEKMDHGPVLAQQELTITPEETSASLHNKLTKKGADLLEQILPQWLNKKIKPQEQNHQQASYTKIITREDGKINWQDSAEQIEKQIRAFTPWPGAFTFINNKRLKIKSAEILNDKNCLSKTIPGKIFTTPSGELGVICREGCLKLQTVQLEGKCEMSGQKFIIGHDNIIGSVFQ